MLYKFGAYRSSSDKLITARLRLRLALCARLTTPAERFSGVVTLHLSRSLFFQTIPSEHIKPILKKSIGEPRQSLFAYCTTSTDVPIPTHIHFSEVHPVCPVSVLLTNWTLVQVSQGSHNMLL